MKILFIQVEFNIFAASLPWTYWCHAGLAKALIDAGNHVDFVLTCQSELILELAHSGNHDIVIINDVIHGFGGQDGAIFRVPIAPLRLLKSRGIPMVGVLIETVFHESGDRIDDVLNPIRQRVVEQAAVWLDFILAYDLFDAEILRGLGINALWAPFISRAPELEASPEKSRAFVFYGSMYEKRKRFLAEAGCEHLIQGGYINYPAAFSNTFSSLIQALCRPEVSSSDGFRMMSIFKASTFEVYAVHLLAQPIIINLPSIFKGIPCRVIESLAMGRPSLSPLPRHPRERALLEQAPSGSCWLYDERYPNTFLANLRAAVDAGPQPCDRTAIQKSFRNSPFWPEQFASNFNDFVGGSRAASAIEANYHM